MAMDVPGLDRYRRAVMRTRRYRYVGPTELRDRPIALDAVAVDTPSALDEWLAGREPADLAEAMTFVVSLDGLLRLAPRRSEHIALAAAKTSSPLVRWPSPTPAPPGAWPR